MFKHLVHSDCSTYYILPVHLDALCTIIHVLELCYRFGMALIDKLVKPPKTLCYLYENGEMCDFESR